MDFENIKKMMDSENTDDVQIPSAIKNLKESAMPIQKIRKTMKGEIITQLVFIIFFFTIPVFFVKMYEIPRSIYYITMFVTCLITLGYLIKMMLFLNKTNNIGQNSKDVILSFIYDLKLTLEVYKTAIISGSLLLPISLLALLMGSEINKHDLFTDLFLFNVSLQTLLLYILGYLVGAIVIYFGTVAWTNSLYGVHIKELEKILKQFNS
jgi:hypothetical protein